MRDRILWILSLVFIAWMVWAETSFQFFEHDLAQASALQPGAMALLGCAFLLPYGLVQIPVGWLLDRRQVERLLLLGGVAAASFTLVFSRGESFQSLLLSRAGMGLACAVAFPASGLLARRSLPQERFALAMGFTDSLLGLGATFAALMPLLIGSQNWRLLVQVQSLSLAVLVVLPLALLAWSRPSLKRSSSAPTSEPEGSPNPRQLLQGALMYAWGGGLLFGLGQYALISRLRGWNTDLQVQATLLLSLGISVSMVLSGALAKRPQRRSGLLLVGSLLATISLFALGSPAGGGELQRLAGAGLGLGIGTSVMAFPMAEEAAAPGKTAFVVALVNTCGTVSGGLMMLISGLLLQLSSAEGLPLAMGLYGVFTAAGIPLALWIKRSGPQLSGRH